MRRLISFLGTGNYQRATYEFEGKRIASCYVAASLSQLLEVDEVFILATDQAWNKHGTPLSEAFRHQGLAPPQRKAIPSGSRETELWRQFEAVVEVMQDAESGAEVVFDITHGFRSQPFFASAAIDYCRSVLGRPEQLRVVYGAFEAKGDDNVTPIWDLTVYVDALDWSRALLLFLRTGRVDEVVEPTERLGRSLRKQWYQSGCQGPEPKLQQLAGAFKDFGKDLVTVRTGSMLCGESATAKRLLQALEESRAEVSERIPPLSTVLDRIAGMIRPLCTSARLSEPQGQRALQALAKLYLRMGRYAEAAATLREGWITKYASNKADWPDSPDFDKQAREQAENNLSKANPWLLEEIGDVRNDIEHAGFRKKPLPPDTIVKRISKLITRWENSTDQPT